MAILAPDYLLWKAGQVRRLAEPMSDSWQRKALCEIAQLYEWLADEMQCEENRANFVARHTVSPIWRLDR